MDDMTKAVRQSNSTREICKGSFWFALSPCSWFLGIQNSKSKIQNRQDPTECVGEAGSGDSMNTRTDEAFQRSAIFVDKILKGTKPADIPVEQPKRFEFIVNLKTAKQIGLTIPPNVLARADKVIR